MNISLENIRAGTNATFESEDSDFSELGRIQICDDDWMLVHWSKETEISEGERFRATVMIGERVLQLSLVAKDHAILNTTFTVTKHLVVEDRVTCRHD